MEEEAYLGGDQFDVGHGDAIDEVAVDEKANFDALVGEANYVGVGADHVVRFRVPLECIIVLFV